MSEIPEMLERVARAICKAQTGVDGDLLDHRVIRGEGDEPPRIESKPFWCRFEAEARAVIEAMREPTATMAGAPYMEIEVGRATATATWQAMIDAALREPSVKADVIAATETGDQTGI